VAQYKDYAVSGIWFEENVKNPEQLSHVMLHRVSKHNKILKGAKTEKGKLIELLENHIVYTLKWNYKEGRWNWGSLIQVTIVNGQACLNAGNGEELNSEMANLMNMNIQPV